MGQGHHGLAVVEHVVAAHLVGAVGQAPGVLVIGRHQQQPGRIGGTTTHHHHITPHGHRLTIPLQQHGLHAAARGIGLQTTHLGPGQQRHIRSSQGRPHTEHIRVGFGVHQTGEAIAAITPAATAKGHVGLIQHHPGRGMEGMQPCQSQIIHQLLDAGLMGHRRMGIGTTAGGLGGIFPPLAMHVIHLLGPLVIGLEVAVAQGPGR